MRQPSLYVFISCMVVRVRPYSGLLFEMCRASTDFGLFARYEYHNKTRKN
jgi:hypothetical protein